jgi:hypothetical protein
MKAIDGFLARHEVDVGKSLGLLILAGAVLAVYGMIGQLLIGRVHLDFTVIVGLILGSALWKHRPWSRTLLLVAHWAGVCLIAVMLIMAPFVGTAGFTLTLGSVEVREPSVWTLYVGASSLVPLLGFVLAVLHSKRARTEFGVRKTEDVAQCLDV